jgi:hypothetical protein
MFNIFGHKRNVNQTYIEILPHHRRQNGYHQKHRQQQMLARMWGKRNTSTLLVEMKLITTTMESSVKDSQKLK